MEGHLGFESPPCVEEFLLEGVQQLAAQTCLGRRSCLTLFVPFVQESQKTTFHSLWRCPFAEAVWQECSRRIQKLTCEETDGRWLLLFFFEKLNNEEVLEALTLARMIWLRRNSMVFRWGFSPPLKVISEVQSSLENGAHVSSNLAHSISELEVGNSFLSKPPQGWWKISWDAAIDKEARRMGIGAVIRDGNRTVVAARVSFLPYIDDPSAAEALAAWYAVKLGREMGGTCIIIEGDSMEVVMALRKSRYSYQNYGHLLEDIATSLSFFQSVQVAHVRCDANKVAHVLAKSVITHLLDKVWREDYPSFIHNLVLVGF